MQNEPNIGYPNICTKWCRNRGRNDCPASSKCMAKDDKPFFRPFIPVQETRFERWCRKRRIRKICKVNNYNCAECIYHEHNYCAGED